MNMLHRISLMIVGFSIGFSVSSSAMADESRSEVRGEGSVTSPQACTPKNDPRLNLAEVSQADCCKGHKGVCGCRAGKIVCCDNTVSEACTCHADDPVFTP